MHERKILCFSEPPPLRRRRAQRSHTNMIIHISPIIIILTTGWSYRGACEVHGYLAARWLYYTKFGFTPSRRLALDKARQWTAGCREHVIICIYLKIFTSRKRIHALTRVIIVITLSKWTRLFCEKINFPSYYPNHIYIFPNWWHLLSGYRHVCDSEAYCLSKPKKKQPTKYPKTKKIKR